MGHKLWLHFGLDAHAFATYFDVHQGYQGYLTTLRIGGEKARTRGARGGGAQLPGADKFQSAPEPFFSSFFFPSFFLYSSPFQQLRAWYGRLVH